MTLTLFSDDLRELIISEFNALSERIASPLVPAWLSIADAAKYSSFSDSHIRVLIGEKRLFVCGQHKSKRIYRPHLDEQIARGFPILDYSTAAEQADKILASQPVSNFIPHRKSFLPEPDRFLTVPKSTSPKNGSKK
jgi:hypothetical protein